MDGRAPRAVGGQERITQVEGLARDLETELSVDTSFLLNPSRLVARQIQERYLAHPRIGGQAMDRRHLVVVGGRGSGKTAALVRAHIELRSQGVLSTVVDIQTILGESHKVTAAVLRHQLLVLEHHTPRRQVVLLRDLRSLAHDLGEIRTHPADALLQHAKEVSDKATRDRMRGGGLWMSLSRSGDSLWGTMRSLRSRRTANESSFSWQYGLTPWQHLNRHVLPKLQDILDRYARRVSGDPKFLFLDDLHHLDEIVQLELIRYLVQAFKGRGWWVKVSGVTVDLTRPATRGGRFEVPHDVSVVSLDPTDCDRLQHQFLEDALSTCCDRHDLRIGELMDEAAQVRLTEASGGLPREFLRLVSICLTAACHEANAQGEGWRRLTIDAIEQIIRDHASPERAWPGCEETQRAREEEHQAPAGEPAPHHEHRPSRENPVHPVWKAHPPTPTEVRGHLDRLSQVLADAEEHPPDAAPAPIAEADHELPPGPIRPSL